MKLCSFPDCEKISRRLGLCEGHYQQHRRGRTLTPLGQRSQSSLTLQQKVSRALLRAVLVQHAGCLEAVETPGSLYPMVVEANTNKHFSLCRLVLERKLNRSLVRGEQAIHSCDNTRCINPDHIQAGSPQDNARDRSERSNTRLVSEEERSELLSLWASGMTQAESAKRVGVPLGAALRALRPRDSHVQN